jgi:selenocysteine-specific elongation factor
MTESRELVLGTAGHIDHGKTALVRALTGVDTDRLPEERKRGITIDLGFAALDLGSCRMAVVDVPGHERFIRNMLAGATGIDAVLMVVAADDSVMPQTREHLEILRLLGVPSGVIALTKCDLADPGWLDLVESEVRDLVQGTALADAAIVRTSAATGMGIDDLRDAIRSLSTDDVMSRPDPGLFRLAIDRSFTRAGHGTVVTGTVASGAVAVGDDLEWWPQGRELRVRGLQQHGLDVDRIGRGARAAINLGGVHHAEIVRGQELASVGYLKETRCLTAALRSSPDAARPLKHRARYRLHIGTAEVMATLTFFDAAELRPGDEALGQLHLAEPVVAVHGQPLVLRAESPPATLGGGTVLEPLARRVRRRDALSRRRIGLLSDPDPSIRLGAVLESYGVRPWSVSGLSRDTGLSGPELSRRLASFRAEGRLIDLPIGPRRTVATWHHSVAILEDRVLRALARLHDANPRQAAIRRAHVVASLPDLPSDSLVAGLIDRLLASGSLVGDSRAVARRDFQPRLSQGERKLKSELEAALRNGGLTPPDAADLARMGGVRASVVPELLALLAAEGRIIDIGAGLFLSAEAEGRLRSLVRDRLQDGSTISMAELRDLLETTRKFAVPLGEYLDRIGWARREGDVRRLGPAATRSSQIDEEGPPT